MSGDLVPHPSAELVRQSEVPDLLEQVRPVWQGRELIGRVRRLLPVDPSSACQRIFNASVYDLKEKIVLAGLDLAADAARTHKLPTAAKPEDIENYSTSSLLELAFRVGLVSRPEWKRLKRVYDIRRDLEHEDAEYEAGVEDCIYVFKVCVEVVLSRDPVQLLHVTDVKEVVEAPQATTINAQLVDDFAHAPDARQLAILGFLLNYALDESQPDIVRENAYNALGRLAVEARESVKISATSSFQEKVGRGLTELQARVAFTGGIMPYLPKAQRRSYFDSVYAQMSLIGYGWRAHPSHENLLSPLEEVGGIAYMPEDQRRVFVKWLALCYIGEPGGYGDWGRNRRVFYSDAAAPIILRILQNSPELAGQALQELESDPTVASELTHPDVRRRWDNLLDRVQPTAPAKD